MTARVTLRNKRTIGVVGIAAVLVGGSQMPAAAEPHVSQPENLLIGIGDSFTAGTGVEPYELADCMRSTDAYPQVAAKLLHMKSINDACVAATTSAFTKSYHGQLPQLSNVYDAAYVVTTIGGNDLGVDSSIIDVGLMGNTKVITKKLPLIEKKLMKSYAAIKTAAPMAKVYAVAYPDFFPQENKAMAECMGIGGYTLDLPALHKMIQVLNDTIRIAAKKSGVEFVDVENIMAGHEMCTDSPWVYGPNSKYRWHPNTRGQAAMGGAVAAAIEGLPPVGARDAAAPMPKETKLIPSLSMAVNRELRIGVAEIVTALVSGEIKPKLEDGSDLSTVADISLLEDGKVLFEASAAKDWELQTKGDATFAGEHTFELQLQNYAGKTVFKQSQEFSLDALTGR